MGRIAVVSLTLVTLAVWLVYPGQPVPAADKPAAPAKWEYKVFTLYDLQRIVKNDEKLAKDAQLFYERKDAEDATAREKATRKMFALTGYKAGLALGKLGEDGWELAFIRNDENGSEYYLKRPKLVAVDPPTNDPTKLEIEKIQGSWENKAEKVEYFFKGNNFTFLIEGKPGIKGTYKLDVTKTPKRIDFTIDYLAGDPKSKGKVSPCIYELDEDGFRLCQPNGDATEPPKKFDIDAKNGVTNYYKRVKP